MKRLLLVLLGLTMLLGACGASQAVRPSALDRDAVLPLEQVSRMAGCDMKLAYDHRDDRKGMAVWAWEETQGPPRLLYVEIYLPAADPGGRYEAAEQRSQTLSAPKGMQACGDGRSVHLRFGGYAARIVEMGALADAKALALLQQCLLENLPAVEIKTEK